MSEDLFQTKFFVPQCINKMLLTSLHIVCYVSKRWTVKHMYIVHTVQYGTVIF